MVKSPVTFQCFTKASLTLVWASAGMASAQVRKNFVFMVRIQFISQMRCEAQLPSRTTNSVFTVPLLPWTRSVGRAHLLAHKIDFMPQGGGERLRLVVH